MKYSNDDLIENLNIGKALKKTGKALKKTGKAITKTTKTIGKEVKKTGKTIGKEVKKVAEQAAHDVKKVANKAIEEAKKAAEQLAKTLKGVLNKVPEIIKKILDAVINPMKNFFDKIFDLDFIKRKITELGLSIKDNFLKIANNIFDLIKKQIDNIIKELENAFNIIIKKIIEIFNIIKKALEKLVDLIIEFGKKLLEKIKITFSNIFKQFKIIIDKMIDFFMEMKDQISKTINKVISSIVDIGETIKNGASHFVKKILKPIMMDIFENLIYAFSALANFLKKISSSNTGFIRCIPVYLYPFVPLIPFSLISMFVEFYSKKNEQCITPYMRDLRKAILLSIKNPVFTICLILILNLLIQLFLKHLLSTEMTLPSGITLIISILLYLNWIGTNANSIPMYIDTFNKYYPKPPLNEKHQKAISIQIIWFIILTIGAKILISYIFTKYANNFIKTIYTKKNDMQFWLYRL